MVGLDREAAKRAFDGFVGGRTLTANQIQFVSLIIDYLTQNGWMHAAQLYESPFTDFSPKGVEGVFWPRAGDPVIERIQRLKTLEVEVNWDGHGAKKKFNVVRSSEPRDLVFQSLRIGAPMNDQNILRRHLRPAAVKLRIDPKKATWHSLRRGWGPWMAESGADPKSIQFSLRHSRVSTSIDIYAQFVPEAQQRAVARTMEMLDKRAAKQAAPLN